MSRQANQSRPSRWDALDGPSSSSFSSSSRRRPRLQSNEVKPNTSHGGYTSSHSKGKQGGLYSPRPGNSAGDNWRRRAAANDEGNIPPQTTVEEEKVRDAAKQLQIDVKSFLEKSQGESGESSSEEVQKSVRHSIEQLAASLFHVADATKFLEHPPLHEPISTNKSLPNISNDLIWEAAYSLLRHMQLLSQSRKHANACRQFIHSISSVALVCLRALIYNQQQLQADQSTRIKAMSDLRMCECASILVDALGCSLFDGDATNTDEILYKATLFSCLAKIIAISTMNTPVSLSNQKNAKERRGPLFPWGAEKTVTLVVKQTALPFIELLTEGDITLATKMSYCHGAIECLFLLLQDPNFDDRRVTNQSAQLSKHAAAILAPLVVDVLPDGKEKHRVNPLRSRTLGAISACWEWSFDLVENGKQSSVGTSYVLMPCQCLAAALNALSVLRNGKVQTYQNANVYEINVSAIARQLQSMIQSEDLVMFRPKFLDLLTLLCLAYPTSSASQWHLFLEQTGVKPSALLSLLGDGTSALACENTADESWISLPSVLRATSSLLSAMPLSLWISGDARPSMRMSGGNFSSRVRNVLLNVINCTVNLMTAIKGRISCGWSSNKSSSDAPLMEISMVQVSQLAGKLCAILPFNGENSVFVQPASNLVQCAGDIYVLSAKTIANTTSISGHELKHTLLYKAMSNFSNAITESLGAKVTACSHPAGKWLSDASSYEFIGLLLTDSCWRFSLLLKDRMDMLSSVAKRSPWILAREPFNLAAFCELCAAQCKSQNDVESKILGLKLIDAFILGRKIVSAESISHNTDFSAIMETFCPLLLVALEDRSAAVRSSSVASFGSLLKDDLMDLFLSDADSSVEGQLSIDWTPLESILSLCTSSKEDNANVRSSSCKAIGDISTICISGSHSEKVSISEEIPLSDGFTYTFTRKICEVMTSALTDDNALVRGMALFAIGNTALALKGRYHARQGPPFASMKRLFPSVCECLGDKDEKVVANAIRTISHMAYFVFDDTSATLDVYRSLLSDLSAKIKLALDDATGETCKELTWKQRNGAKKHAWGSCTTIGTLLSFSNMLPYMEDSHVEPALSSLFRCIQISNVISEKIVAAAIKALASLPATLWHHLSGKCDSIGCGLATCFGFLHEVSFVDPYMVWFCAFQQSASHYQFFFERKGKSMASYHHDVGSLVNLLLGSAKKKDFCTLFLIQEKIPFSVEYFYQWMVTHDIESGILEEIAAAVSSPEVQQILDVSVVQMFLSRTIQQNRRQGSPCKVNVASLAFDENDEDGDEL
ncbi:hypothetical protein ACHAXR_008053 [Thalassiosira sp. AJA248-18]